eukprot:TRINITY_DN3663_c0_g1_i2.p1 TRINITY_DN3663_c0_g1~~TRINITY_DN3663_c0_g1_i2.p1  ORF type:complete len:299 (+),score=45.42 TRINITY_DN3663_c0_g1_i2:99-995(+)
MTVYTPTLSRVIAFENATSLAFESEFSPSLVDSKITELWWLPLGCVVAYLASILMFNPRAPEPSRPPTQKASSARRRPTVRPGEAAWNLFLAAFSVIGAIRVVPRLVGIVSDYGFSQALCVPASDTYSHGAAGLWVFFFCMSKIPELFDTVLLLMKRRYVIFLHWYHHASVLLYCWHAYVTKTPAGIWFSSMNLVVHGVMYWYYFLSACGKRPSWDIFVTSLQILQMIIGVAVTAVSWQQLDQCPAIDASNLLYATVMSVCVQWLPCGIVRRAADAQQPWLQAFFVRSHSLAVVAWGP